MKYHLAQVNVAKAKAPMDDPIMKEFVDQLEAVNRLADQSQGFIWRLASEEDNATAIRVFEDDMMLINLSVWESFDALKNFVYSGMHFTVFKQKKQWFDRMSTPSLALWWIPSGHFPDPEEAKNKLETLAAKGPSQESFGFAKNFPTPELVTENLIR